MMQADWKPWKTHLNDDFGTVKKLKRKQINIGGVNRIANEIGHNIWIDNGSYMVKASVCVHDIRNRRRNNSSCAIYDRL